MTLVVRPHSVSPTQAITAYTTDWDAQVVLEGTGSSGFRYQRNFKKADLRDIHEAISLYLIKEARSA